MPDEMRIGAVLPTSEIGDDPAVLRDWVQTAEGVGFHHVLVYDHVLGAVHADREPPLMGPYTERDGFHEPFTLLSWMAAATETIELTTGILILPQRQTALVAKQAAQLDLLSGGRLRLGVGSGWNPVEYEALGVPWDDRGARMTEQVELMRALWRDDVVDYEGRFHRVDRAGLLPRSGRAIPVWFGGFTTPALRRAARIGDGFLFGGPPTRMHGMRETLDALLEDAGRKAEPFGRDASIDFADGPDAWQREIVDWREQGGSHLSLRAMDTGAEFFGLKRHGYDGPRAHIEALETFAREVFD